MSPTRHDHPGAGGASQRASGVELLGRLGAYLGRYWARYLLGAVFLLATTACALAIPWVIRGAIDAVSRGEPLAAIRGAALSIVALALLQGATRAASRFALLGASQRVEADMRNDVFERLLRLPVSFYQARRTGDLMSRATNDLHGVSMLIGFGLLSLTSTALVFAGTVTAMVRLDPWLTLLALAPTPALVLVIRAANARAHGASLAVQEQLSALSDKVQENLSGTAVVRAYTMESREIARFHDLNDELRRRHLRQAWVEGSFSPLMGIVAGLGTLVVLWFGGKGVIDGRISLGDLVAFASYLAYLAWPILALGWVLAASRRGLTAMQRIVELLDAGPLLPEPEATSAMGQDTSMRGDIAVSGLTFAYPSGQGTALQDVSLRVPAGTSLAVVGPTGAGKSTLASLLVRLWEPPAGSVLLGGRDVTAIPLAEFRRVVAYVPQESLLFSRTLRENVLMGASDEGLGRAGTVAGLTEDVGSLPRGWDTVVGERGLTLSGGQRQRAALARALIREPRLLVLDDPFASVDARKEAEILAQLQAVLRGRTTVFVTHRLRAASLADHILVLDGGRVVEQGTHEALLARQGLYARLWRRSETAARLEASS